ncbi:protein SSUH2 homolog [Latimeria chalumnae]|uniref:protein SSUH2 homolog n=1 Tax=Latimeria chalumnae TaxID=7897 RepID=UPI00313F0E4A
MDISQRDRAEDSSWMFAVPPPKNNEESQRFQNNLAIPPVSVEILTPEYLQKIIMAWFRKKWHFHIRTGEEIIISGIIPSLAFYYSLETFTEERSTCNNCEPYQVGRETAVASKELSPWEVPCSPDKLFKNQTKIFQLPGTDKVAPCVACNGKGLTGCEECLRTGKNPCKNCKSTGKIGFVKTCWRCKGDRVVSCKMCVGQGLVSCTTCRGKCKLCYFKQLKVDYRNRLKDKVIVKDAFPVHLIHKAQGEILYDHSAPLVPPITDCFQEAVNFTSVSFVQETQTAWPNSVILQQRQHLLAIPVTEVHYKWKEHTSRLWVFGKNKRMYFEDDPQDISVKVKRFNNSKAFL